MDRALGRPAGLECLPDAGCGTRHAGRCSRLARCRISGSLLLDLADLVAADKHQPRGPIADLAAYDAAHDTRLVDTLRAWLDAFGDTPSAAAALHVHPNTFRYRLRRISEVGGLDLTDPRARFAAMLQLHLLAVLHTKPTDR